MIAAIDRYLALRRSAGFVLSNAQYLLRSFAAFAADRQQAHICTATAIDWASRAPSSAQRHTRYQTVRQFAEHVRMEDPQHDLPPPNHFGHRKSRRVPRIYTAAEIDRLILAATQLSAGDALRPQTYATLISLLAATGLRISEALHLRYGDVTPDGLLIRKTKFQKTRLVPLHETAVAGLERYLAQRRAVRLTTDHVFVNDDGRPLEYGTVYRVFGRLAEAAGIAPLRGHRPRLHELRHTFALRALQSTPAGRQRIGQHMLALSTYLGHVSIDSTYWYLESTPELLTDIAAAGEVYLSGGHPMSSLAPHIEAFLREHLPRHRAASAHTCDSYAYSFQSLFEFAARRLKTVPSALMLEQLDAPLIAAFLEHLESARRNSAQTRNIRLAAIRSFFRFVQHREPGALEQTRRILAIPYKKTDTRLVAHLDKAELQALLDAPDPPAREGIRDRAMLHVAVCAGLRVSELKGLRMSGVAAQCKSIHVLGKGRRERALPLWKPTASALRAWLSVRGEVAAPEVFVNARGEPFSRWGVAYVLRSHADTASTACPSLRGKQISPHVLRHTCAMIVLQATQDIRKVSLWLGHSTLATTEIYVRADPSQKLEAIEAVVPPHLRKGKFRPPDRLIALLRTRH